MRAHLPASHRLRRGRQSQASGVYLVTFTTYQRMSHFADFAASRQICSVIASESTWPHARLLAWILMPDHWHGLIELTGTEPLSRAVARTKSVATMRWRETGSEHRRLWAHGFHDRALRREESLLDCARYIVLNPVRAGLVERCGDYPFWDAVWVE